MTAAFDVTEHTIQASHIREYARATAESQDDALLLHVKQYTPKDNPSPQRGDLTIIGAHANGFPKELYEPLWDDFHGEALKHKMRIRGIWILDVAWQGRSGILNRCKLGNDPCWNDAARDIIHMINTFRMPRPLVGIGHSFGGNALTNVVLLHPRILETIILIDPVIGSYNMGQDSLAQGPVGLSIRRRFRWPSRAAAAEAFRNRPFYQTWDARVFEKWLQYGICSAAEHEAATPARLRSREVPESREADDGEVTLTTTRDQEVFTYFRPSWPAFDASGTKVLHRHLVPDLDLSLLSSVPNFPVYRPEGANTHTRLPHVRAPVLFITGGLSFTSLSPLSGGSDTLDSVWLQTTGTGTGGSGGAAVGRVRQITHPDYGHLIPFEAPAYCASHAASWTRQQLDGWRKDEAEFDAWARKPLVEKTTVSDEYKRYIGFSDDDVVNEKAKL